MAASSKTHLNVIGQIAVPVKDLDRALAFYRDQLGMQFLFQAPPGLAFFNCGGVRLMLDAPAKKDDAENNAVIYFKVEDIQSVYKNLQENGVTFESEPHLIAKMPDHELWMAFIRDPDKNLLAIMAEVKS